jgi:hypothetical protein
MAYPEKSDIIASIKNPQLILDEFLKGVSVSTGVTGNPIVYVGGFSMVFIFVKNGEKWAIRIWHVELNYHRLEDRWV